ncbi:hypothetical protein ES319_D10G183600v1 [Gossypium barbadense]|uniref:Large ribosomal subunit protein bL33c n=2 Tax=Gossypium TaxID=3633 RepID=A0A1U8KE35_GOSHI|nr:50S ribosomal protein L33-like [Gossypium hirsutum]KAB2009671.1 hypothetical protein ES319_D10G183600v1 [Gossypium barbadense]
MFLFGVLCFQSQNPCFLQFSFLFCANHQSSHFPRQFKEMGDKKKKTFMFIRLVSAAGTGFFYVKRKSARKVAEKLEFRKYDPRVNRHVLFTEQKMK